MKAPLITKPTEALAISRHSLGMPAHVNAKAGLRQVLVGAFVRAVVRLAVIVETFADAMLSQGFVPENGTPCSAHWNRAYIGGNHGANYDANDGTSVVRKAQI